jgi:Cft2 family RNA processing exonuclease
MLFTNLTRHNEIGANCYLVETTDARVLIDSGMHPKLAGRDALPDHHLAAGQIDAILISHAHHDHIGSLPVAQRHFPGAEVFLTELTALLADAMLHNSVNVMSSQREELNIAEYPLFTHREIEELSARWRAIRCGREFAIHGGRTKVEFFDAGHIPGSAGLRLGDGERTLFYTGDVQFEDQTFCLGARFPRDPADILVMETTRGAAARAGHYTRETEIQRFASVVRRTFERGGCVLVPVFALGKTQEFLLILHECKELGLLPWETPVHLGGLGTKLTQIIDRYDGPIHRRRKELELLRDTGVHLPGRKRRGPPRPIDAVPGHLYALSSGMMAENTTSNAFARKFLDDPRNAICFVGYADPDSVAGAILAAKPEDQIVLDHRWPPVPLSCEVEKFDFSGHATRDDLLAFARDLRPRKIVLVHGDPDALEWFAAALGRHLPGSEIIIPAPGQTLQL